MASINWPELPSTGFVSGRMATQADIDSGSAAFMLPGGTPIRIPVPQYGFQIEESGVRTPGIVIQAEEVGGIKVIGFKPLSSDGFAVAKLEDFEFLGTTPPTN